MSPFKVVRCRYFTEDGQAIPPYCSARRHCTFLHPGDKGWPGGDPVPELNKRQDERDRVSERSRPFVNKFSDRALKLPYERSMPKACASITSMLDLVSARSNSPTLPGGSHKSKEQAPVHSIIKSFHDIAKYQSKITRDREELDKAVGKLSTFRELSDSLSKISTASAAAVAPTLEAILKNRNQLEAKLEDDMGHFSKLWDGVFSIFLRAICRQFDSEVEAGTDYLRQEARMLVKSFPKNTSSTAGRDIGSTSIPKTSHSRSPCKSLSFGGPHEHAARADVGTNTTSGSLVTKEMVDEDALILAVNPPIGLSDNGWGRKRRRVSSGSFDYTGQFWDGSIQGGDINDIIVKMQEQLEEQRDKITLLTKQNDELAYTVQRQSSLIPTVKQAGNSESPVGASATFTDSQVVRDDIAQIRENLHAEVLSWITPALEEQRRVNEHWEARLDVVAEELRKMSIMGSAGVRSEDVTMDSVPQIARSDKSPSFPGKNEGGAAAPFGTCA